MKHADSNALKQLEPLLEELRQRIPPLKEKQPGIFYCKAIAFLHFHQDPLGIFADLKVDRAWVRYPVNENRDWVALLKAVDAALPFIPGISNASSLTIPSKDL